tara:strand:+ start:3485 stop:4945 length:1461 start_codon:yes stop_codon:yes gene_type:complete
VKTLLIAPYLGEMKHISKEETMEHLLPSSALVYLASFLRSHNHEPILLDLNTKPVHKQVDKSQYCQTKIIECVEGCDPKLIGINCLFSGVFPTVLEFAKVIRSNFPMIKIAIGGIHPTTYPQSILENCEEIDYVVLGEGETQLVELASCIERGDFKNLSDIKSFAYRTEEGSIKINTEKSLLDLDDLPMPAWDLVDFKDYEIDMSHYYNPKQHVIKNRVPVSSSRGCPMNCNFCDMFLTMGKKHRRSSAGKFVDEIEFLYKNKGMNYFSIMDDNLTLNNRHILEVCDEIKRRKIDIQFETPNGVQVSSLSEEVIAALADAGLIRTNVAIESGSDYIRNLVIGKELEREKIYEVCKLLKKYKIMTGGFFVIGFPEETNETLTDTYEMMNELKLDRMKPHIAIPFPGTRLFEQVKRDKLFTRYVDFDNLWRTPVSHAQGDFIIRPYNMSIEDLRKWRSKLAAVNEKYLNYNSNRFCSTPPEKIIAATA